VTAPAFFAGKLILVFAAVALVIAAVSGFF
jgi:hypothetical protein